MMLKGDFIHASQASRVATDPARIEGRVLSFFGFGLAFLAFDRSLGSTLFTWPLVGLAFVCMAPLLWYCCCFVKTFLGLDELGSSTPGSRGSGRPQTLAARQCRRASAALDVLIAGEDVSSQMLAGGGVRSRSSSRPLSWVQATLSEYQAGYRPWIEGVFYEADSFGVIPPSSVELLEGPGISQLRSLSSVLREAADELGR